MNTVSLESDDWLVHSIITTATIKMAVDDAAIIKVSSCKDY